MICDEGHRLKSSGTYLFRVSYLDEEKNFLVSNTGTTKTMQALCTFPSMRRLIITVHSIQNDLEEFYNVVNFVNPTVRVLEIVKRSIDMLEHKRSNTTGTRKPELFRNIYAKPIMRGRDLHASKKDRDLGESRSKEL